MTNFLIQYCTHIISALGYPGLTLLMTLESMIFPLPSEAIMPFAGFLWGQGQMNFSLIVIFSTMGSMIGSILSYCVGYFGGEPFLKKYHRIFLINEKHLEKSEKFFKKYGNPTIFVSRFVPVVRHFISLPAGMARMNFIEFLMYTILGAAGWNSFLTYIGFVLGKNWSQVRQWGEIMDILLIGVIGILIIFWIIKRRKKSD